MAPACERSVGVATRRSLRSLAVPALLALVLGTACTSTPTKPDPPMVTLDTVRILRVADARADVVLVLRLTNPNRFDIVVEIGKRPSQLVRQQLPDGRLARGHKPHHVQPRRLF